MKNKNILVVRNLIKCLGIASLQNPEVVANLIRAFGIVQWGPAVFGYDEIFKNNSTDMAGIYQTPKQMAQALVHLSQFEINSYLEIGVFQGGNFVFVSEYLKRFNPGIICVGIDPTNFLNPEIKETIDAEPFLNFKPITSDQVAGEKFDLVFIDGEHTAEWIRRDYENVGKVAKICMLHDVNEISCPEVTKFWQSIKTEKSVEFISEVQLQGIGIL